eukprot:GILJ01019527.1.p1 GENE.GILJ01019527.1~~GILJ01019527.1.p1  ORF type:complete len:929 (+),score=130.45 GILJ01019527.1:154-2787(+)
MKVRMGQEVIDVESTEDDSGERVFSTALSTHSSIVTLLDNLLDTFLTSTTTTATAMSIKGEEDDEDEDWPEVHMEDDNESWENLMSVDPTLSGAEVLKYCLQTDLEFLTTSDLGTVDRMTGMAKHQLERRQSSFVMREALDSKMECLQLSDGLSVQPLPSALAVKMSLELYDVDETIEHALQLLGLNADFPLHVLLTFDQSAVDMTTWSDILPATHVHFWQRIPSAAGGVCGGGIAADDAQTSSRSFSLESYLPKIAHAYYSQHEKDISTSQVFEGLLFHIKDYLGKCTNYCVICSTRHEGDSTRLRPCNRELCLFSFEEVGLGCNVLAEIRNHPQLVNLDLTLASAAIVSNRAEQIFEPFPSFCLLHQEARTRSGYFDNGDEKASKKTNKDLPTLVKLVRQLPPLSEIPAHVATERDLREWLRSTSAIHNSTNSRTTSTDTDNNSNSVNNNMIYKLIKFVLATNRLNLQHLDGGQLIPGLPPDATQYAVVHNSPDKEAAFQLLKEKHGSFFAWHGSSTENWYSILRNGLRILSNTKLMTAGAAYGRGIYVSPTTQVSMGYSTKSSSSSGGWTHSSFQSGSVALGIFEVINNGVTSKNHSNDTIWVVNDDACITIRYLLVCSPTVQREMNNVDIRKIDLASHFSTLVESLHTASLTSTRVQERRQLQLQRAEQRALYRMQQEDALALQDEQRYQVNHVKAEVAKMTGQGSRVATTVLMKEIRKMARQQLRSANPFYRMEIVDENCYHWNVALTVGGFGDCQLAKDLKAYAKKYQRPAEVSLEIIFPEQFPFSPPFVRVVRPRFKFHTGHVTVGGSICMELLTSSGWSPGYSVEAILVQIQADMIAGGGSVDMANATKDYSMAEAREAFTRVARQHGW